MYLLDTNLVSELRKIQIGKANAGVAAWAAQVAARDLFISVISLEEIEIGILLAERRDPAKGAIFRNWMNQQVLPAFSGRNFRWTSTLPCVARNYMCPTSGLNEMH